MTVGIYTGKFLPLHLGHVSALLHASSLCDELYVFVAYDEEYEKELLFNSQINYIPYQVRLRWIRQLTKDIPHVKSFAIDAPFTEEFCEGLDGALKIKAMVQKPIDFVFSGEKTYEGIYKTLYPTSEHIIVNRHYLISSSILRENGVYQNWDFIPNISKSFYTKKVMIVGTESCGKSTMVHNLAAFFNTNYVKEYGRTFCEDLNGYSDVFTKDLFPYIAYGQKVNEYEAEKNSNKLLFLDTDSLVTKYYYETFSYDLKSRLYDEITKSHHYDLWIFLEPDIEWFPDGLREMGHDELREQNNKHIKSLLDKNHIPYVCVDGDYEKRFNICIKLVKELIK